MCCRIRIRIDFYENAYEVLIFQKKKLPLIPKPQLIKTSNEAYSYLQSFTSWEFCGFSKCLGLQSTNRAFSAASYTNSHSKMPWRQVYRLVLASMHNKAHPKSKLINSINCGRLKLIEWMVKCTKNTRLGEFLLQKHKQHKSFASFVSENKLTADTFWALKNYSAIPDPPYQALWWSTKHWLHQAHPTKLNKN